MRKIFPILGFLVLCSCNPNRIFDEYKDPSGNLEWNRTEILSFDVDIIDTSIDYDILLSLRYAQGFAYSGLKVQVKETSPSGQVEIFEHSIITRDENGYVGEGMVDIWDIEEMLVKNRQFDEAGPYHYEIRHVMDKDKIHMVMEVGLIIEKSEK